MPPEREPGCQGGLENGTRRESLGGTVCELSLAQGELEVPGTRPGWETRERMQDVRAGCRSQVWGGDGCRMQSRQH